MFPQITITVYNMAAVDFSTFFGAFVPHFLQNMDGLDTDQRTTLKANFKTDTVSHLFVFFIATLFLRVYSSFNFFTLFTRGNESIQFLENKTRVCFCQEKKIGYLI